MIVSNTSEAGHRPGPGRPADRWPCCHRRPRRRTGPEPEVRIARLHYEGGGDWYCDPSSLPNWLDQFAGPDGHSHRRDAMRW